MKNIIMLVRYYYPHKGGNQYQCQLLSEYLAAKDYNVYVFTERYSKKLKKNELINKVNVIRLNSANTFFNVNRIKAQNIFLKTFRLVFFYLAESSLMLNIYFNLRKRKEKIDILHIHQNNWIAFWGILGIKKKALVIIKDATLNGFNELKLMPFYSAMKRTIIKVGKFIAVSNDIKNNLINNGIKMNNIFIIPNGAIVPILSNTYTNFKDIIFVGNFDQGKIKGLDILIKAMIKVFEKHLEAKLIIIGRGNRKPYLKILEKFPLIAHRIIFKDSVEDVSSYYINSFVYVLPSRCEGMSNALLEAMSYGMPCISSKVSGSNDLIIDKENGLLFPVENEILLSEAILSLLNNIDFAIRLGRNARITIEKEYKTEIVFNKYESLYQKLMNA